jgi:hypothetical protein
MVNGDSFRIQLESDPEHDWCSVYVANAVWPRLRAAVRAWALERYGHPETDYDAWRINVWVYMTARVIRSNLELLAWKVVDSVDDDLSDLDSFDSVGP